MSEKPILFNTDMVKAILDGKKMQTRRLVKPQPVYNDGIWELDGAGWSDSHIPIYPVPGHSLWELQPVKPGDILWVRETWQYIPESDVDGFYVYAADRNDPAEWKWRPSIHMPREAARLFLQVLNVHLERLQDITVGGLQSEGVLHAGYLSQYAVMTSGCFEQWETLWNSTIKPADLSRYGWLANPWVWVIEFDRMEK